MGSYHWSCSNVSIYICSQKSLYIHSTSVHYFVLFRKIIPSTIKIIHCFVLFYSER
ncbi:unnamed protein product [Brassica oleracea var. botrytis]